MLSHSTHLVLIHLCLTQRGKNPHPHGSSHLSVVCYSFVSGVLGTKISISFSFSSSSTTTSSCFFANTECDHPFRKSVCVCDCVCVCVLCLCLRSHMCLVFVCLCVCVRLADHLTPRDRLRKSDRASLHCLSRSPHRITSTMSFHPLTG